VILAQNAGVAMRKTRRTTRVFQSLLLGLAGAALFASITLPIWRITLDAPQYPEGMGMLIWASTLTGEKPHDLTIINQLNHYIGMTPIIPESIPELRYIAPLIMAFGALCLLAAIRPRLWSTAVLLACLTAAGTAGLVDFWLWEYDYGHNLDPTAAIKVPGASYQPPLIGTTKLLNFTSSSWPAAGGMLMFLAGILIAAALLLAWRDRRNRVSDQEAGARAGILPVLAVLFLGLSACGKSGPAPIHWGEDACHHCRMTLVQKGFAAQRINEKGKVFKYDAIECLLGELESKPLRTRERAYVSDRSLPDAPLLPAQEAVYLRGENVASPMGGGLAGFAAGDSARAFQTRLGGDVLGWADVKRLKSEE
jgi:copper chaperone NosL